jgi:peptide/nickel transport system substrate-binding protein
MGKHHRGLSIGNAALILLLAVSIIAHTSAVSAKTEGKHGGVLRMATGSTVVTLDWHTSTDSSLRYIGWHIFEGLVCFNQSFEPMPQLAESWAISEDGKEYTFALRKGVQFQKGYGEMKAEDVKASLERMFTKGIRANDFQMVKSVEAVDDYTVKLVLSEPSYLLLPLMATPLCYAAVMPAELAAIGPRKLTNEQIVGTGPFELKEWISGERLVLQKFKDYTADTRFDGPQGMGGLKTAYFDEVQILYVTDPNTRAAGLRTGKYDFAENPPYSEFPSIKADKNLTWGKTTLVKNTWNFNVTRPPTDRTAIRRAMMLAFNMEEIMYAQMQGQKDFYSLDSSIFGQGGPWWYPAGEIVGTYRTTPDVEEAKRLLKLGQYKGEEVILLATNPERGAAALVMAEHLKAIGMKVKVEQYDWATAVSRRETGNWTIFMGGATQSQFDPSSMRLFYYGETSKKLWRFNHPMVDAMIDAQANFRDTEKRIEAYKIIQETLWTHLPCFTTGDWFSWSARSAKLKGPTLKTWYMDRFWDMWFE